MSDNVKKLQQLSEPSSGASNLEWSTISNTHGSAPLAATSAPTNHKEAVAAIKQLQELSGPAISSNLDWSTISNTHGHAN
jgi:hypothetical protein